MSWKSIVFSSGKRVLETGPILRWMSDDRVMRVANTVMDAPGRVRAAAGKAAEAWQVLIHGYDLPEMDPSMMPDDAMMARPAKPSKVVKPTREEGPEEESSAATVDEQKLADQIAERTSLAGQAGRDVFQKCYDFKAADNARKMGVYPYFRPLDFNDGPEAVLEGRRVLMLGSNNYLGLTTHPKVREAALEAIRKYGTSMTGSRLVNGSMKLHKEFEEKLAAFHGKEAALVFTTGYQVNIASLSALLSNKHTVALIDRSDHASIYDGVRLGVAVGARMLRYKHNDPESLDRQLESLDENTGAFVVTDGVFSAEGEIANLPELVKVAKKHRARIMVDDAHALGVIGPVGRGTAA
ncbi:MAG TPA: pyridoxal phosphate-dependent aminotransferase family protein, partial [Polyangiaceae bacterium]|nr:pyridoxal phosphate-dependent aminotransferase family protein [Polyangiaceae bacterium]